MKSLCLAIVAKSKNKKTGTISGEEGTVNDWEDTREITIFWLMPFHPESYEHGIYLEVLAAPLCRLVQSPFYL